MLTPAIIFFSFWILVSSVPLISNVVFQDKSANATVILWWFLAACVICLLVQVPGPPTTFKKDYVKNVYEVDVYVVKIGDKEMLMAPRTLDGSQMVNLNDHFKRNISIDEKFYIVEQRWCFVWFCIMWPDTFLFDHFQKEEVLSDHEVIRVSEQNLD